MTVASEKNFENVKKYINDYTRIGDVRNINTWNRSKLIAPVTQHDRVIYGNTESVILLWDDVYAFTIGSQKTSENVLYHDLKELWKDVCVVKVITKLTIFIRLYKW